MLDQLQLLVNDRHGDIGIAQTFEISLARRQQIGVHRLDPTVRPAPMFDSSGLTNKRR